MRTGRARGRRARARWAGRAPHTGRMRVHARGRQPDRLRLAAAGDDRPDARYLGPTARPLGGTRHGHGSAGRKSRYAAKPAATLVVDGFEWQRYPLAPGDRRLQLDRRRGARSSRASIGSDSIEARYLDLPAGRRRRLRGWADSLELERRHRPRARTSRVDGAGRWWRQGADPGLPCSTALHFALPAHRYRLDEPFAVTLERLGARASARSRSAPLDGSGMIQAGRPSAGRRRRATSLVRVLGLDLHDALRTAPARHPRRARRARARSPGGRHRAAPTLRGHRAAGRRAGSAISSAPFLQGVVDYADRRLDANLHLWRTGENVLRGRRPHLPLDLAFARRRAAPGRRPALGPRPRRQRRPRHSRGAHACGQAGRRRRSRPTSRSRAPGTRPRLAGRVDDPRRRHVAARARRPVRRGCRAAPGSRATRCVLRRRGARRAAAARSRSAGRSGWRISPGRCSTSASGPTHFRAIDVRNFLTLVGTGDLQLEGPFFGATLTGNLHANSGVLYFADLVNKRIIDLEDPTIADLVDTTLLRRENLGAKFQNRFLDSLTIDEPARGDGLRRLAPLRRGQHPARAGRSSSARRGRPTRRSGTLEAAARQLHAQDRPGHPRLHGESGDGALLRRPERRRSTSRRSTWCAASGARRSRSSRVITGHAVRTQAHAREHVQSADLRDRSGVVPGHRLPRERGDAAGPGRRAADRPGLLLQRSLERARAGADPGHRHSARPHRDPPRRLAGRPARGTLTQLAAGWQLGRRPSSPSTPASAPNLSQFSYRTSAPASSSGSAGSGGFRAASSRRSSRASRTSRLTGSEHNPYQIGSDILWEREF